MNEIYFYKLTGAGNDFVFIDKKQNPDLSLTPLQIRKICDRRFGIGADGVIIVQDIENYDFEMLYFNADGSSGSLCANGARCAVWFAEKTKRLKNRKAKFISNSIEYSGEVIKDELIRFLLNPPSKTKFNFRIKVADQLIKADFLDTGSPHVVIDISDVLEKPGDMSSNFKMINEFPVYQLGKEIRYHQDFSPSGTNVNFYMIENDKIFIRTYERGVEDETLACGTGSVATAISAFFNKKISPPISLITWGGETLIVNFDVEKQKVSNVTLTGPAKFVFEGKISGNFFTNLE
ncbi:diaminopimelate epimerase [Ignavibacterium album]|uniref:diaminopimelate epimerase n=1 Tax=Ignavibacterium album TaxID=591197 RepID=UPI0035BB2A77